MISILSQILSAEVNSAVRFVANLIGFIGASFTIALIIASDFKN
jgi:hypothetical protein